ncbi:glycosyltransferase family 39 protein [Sphingomonas sp. LY54]|uniref:glycosyltransferase family 39 protein n=1 Tax=Sphingomonas sp. LY54 TaxID=3095343 RepID=UPI002D79D7CC|nr:glycosyltransferase family 39 protein [Sphingomonas sp. LY54]WRP27423.1 glycosyltransferase family 39 protein [Sphingomonas sp. LY54]
MTQGAAIEASASGAGFGGAGWRALVRSPLAAVLLFTWLLIALGTTGFLGRAGDDWQYLQAARCGAEYGLCLPHDHWWRRFPLIAPLAAVLHLLGESRATISIVPLAYGVATIMLFVVMVERQYGRREALFAGLALVATPAFSGRLLELNVDIPELAFVVAAVFCVQSAWRSGRGAWAAAGGAMLALAIMTRPTALPLLPLFLAGLWMTDRRRWIPHFLAGLLALLLVEAAVYGVWAGDPLLSWKLSLAHTRIPTPVLSASVDLSQSPLFNPAYIDGWRKGMGISVHWTVDGLLNLLVHPWIALTLVCASAFLLLDWRRLGSADAGGRPLLFLIAAAASLFGALVYGLAIDPQPRMFLALAAVASLCFGLLAARSWDRRRGLVIAALVILLGKGLIASYDAVDLEGAAALAPRWIAEEGAGLAVDKDSARYFALVPEVGALSRLDAAPAARRLLLVGENDCLKAAVAAGHAGWNVLRAARFERPGPAPVAALRRRQIFFNPQAVPVLCILGRAGDSAA